MLKILWARLQQYVNHELPNIQAGFRKARDQSAKHPLNHQKNQKSSRENLNFCLIYYAKALDCVDHNKLESS